MPKVVDSGHFYIKTIPGILRCGIGCMEWTGYCPGQVGKHEIVNICSHLQLPQERLDIAGNPCTSTCLGKRQKCQDLCTDTEERTKFTLMSIFLELELELKTFKPFHCNSTTKSSIWSNWQFTRRWSLTPLIFTLCSRQDKRLASKPN